MKIKFVVCGLPISPVSTWGEINKYKNEGSPAYSLEDYWRVKGLEVNAEFEKEILNTRKKIGIPKEGLKYGEINTHYHPEDYVWITDVNLRNKTVAFDKSVDFETKRILKEFDCDLFVSKQIKSILLGNIVLPLSSYISDSGEISIKTLFTEDDLDREEYIKSEKEVLIRITSAVTPEAIRQFVSDRYDVFCELLNKLPKKKKFELSKKKIATYQLKKEGLSYKEISFKLVENTDDIPMSVKAIEKIYKKAKTDIESLFHKKCDK